MFLTAVLTAIGPVITKTADRKTIMNYLTRGQTRNTTIDYHEEFEQAQLILSFGMIVNNYSMSARWI